MASGIEEKENPDFQGKNIHPRDKANLLSHLLFLWEIPVILNGYKNQLDENIFRPLQSNQSKLLGNQLKKAWRKEVEVRQSKASLWKALIEVFGVNFFWLGIILIPIELIRMCQPWILGKLLEYYSPDNTGVSKTQAYVYASFLIVTSFLRIFGFHMYWFELEHLGLKIQAACSSLIYRKCLKLSQQALSEASIGQVVTLLSNDVTRFYNGLFRYIHYLWFLPLQILILTYILFKLLGATATFGILVFITFVPLQMYMFKKVAEYRLKSFLKTDQRVRIMNEVIQNIKVIKMFTWEKPFIKLIEAYRKSELEQLKKSLIPFAINVASFFFLYRFAIFACVFAYTYAGYSLNATYVYVLSAFYEIVKVSTTAFFAFGAQTAGEIVNSLKRIESFLKLEEMNKPQKCESRGDIVINNICVKRDKLFEDTLKSVSLEISPSNLIAIIGHVGSGKSTLLHTILNEASITHGSIEIGGTISYASQEPWLFAGSIKENIVFGETFDESRYTKVVKNCGLEQDFESFPCGDLTLVGDRGVRLSGGQKARVSLARAVYKEAEFYLLDDPLSAVDIQVSSKIFHDCIKKFLGGKSTVLVTHQLQFLNQVNYIFVMENGRIVQSGTYEELKESNYFKVKFKTCQNMTEESNEGMDIKKQNDGLEIISEMKENLEEGTVSSRIYLKYLTAGGSIVFVILVALFQLAPIFTSSALDWFLLFWVNLNETTPKNVPNYFVYIYGVTLVLITVFAFASSFIFVGFCLAASASLHKRMVKRIICAPMSFFNVHPSGRILNRFASDIGLIDKNLIITVINTTSTAIHTVVVMIIICFVNYWILIPTFIVLAVSYSWRGIYLPISRNLKRMGAISCSPIFSHLTSTLQGLATIRAFSAEKNQKAIFAAYEDTYTSCCYTFLACASAFGFWVDFCCVIYFSFVILSPLLFELDMVGGHIGLSISQCMIIISMWQYGMKQYSELENNMISVERVEEYSNVETEKDVTSVNQLKIDNGSIAFQDVSLRYGVDQPLVLKQLTLTINPKEKIGVVGRTGAGKSSLINVFFRLFHFEGNVLIDGVNINTVPLQNLRSQISIITQEPVLFSCSIRKNLDPCEEYQDSELWEALDEVELKSIISELPSGLSSKVSEGGLNFSSGQRQLLCLARAMLKRHKIVIFDEVTASVDVRTDELIQDTIRRKFMDCTVLTIAHRLKTVMDCDRILVLEDGCAKEFDSPAKLLENKEGLFYKLTHFGAGEVKT